jgi:excisionase family DNA binding protein
MKRRLFFATVLLHRPFERVPRASKLCLSGGCAHARSRWLSCGLWGDRFSRRPIQGGFRGPLVLNAVTLADKIEQMKKALTVEEFAEMMNVSKKFVYKMLKRSGLESYQLGGIIRLDPVITAQWLRSRTVGKRR